MVDIKFVSFSKPFEAKLAEGEETDRFSNSMSAVEERSVLDNAEEMAVEGMLNIWDERSSMLTMLATAAEILSIRVVVDMRRGV